MAPKGSLRLTYGVLSTASSHFMNIVAQASSVEGTGLSVQAVRVTFKAVAGTFGGKKSALLPVTSVPDWTPMPSGFDDGMEGRIERSAHCRPDTASGMTV